MADSVEREYTAEEGLEVQPDGSVVLRDEAITELLRNASSQPSTSSAVKPAISIKVEVK